MTSLQLEHYFIPAVVTFFMGIVAVPFVRLLALHFNIVDRPNARKVHRRPVPLLGGLGIFIPFVLALILFYHGLTNLNLKGVVISSFLIVLLGFWDDKSGGISWGTKLAGQFIIAMLVVWGFGVRINVFDHFGLNVFVSIFWLVCITNSLNLLDNMDGLSAGVSSIAAFFFFLLAYRTGQYDLAMFALLLSVSAFAFLKYNFSPASIFMGDLGSMFLGFTLGCIAIQLQITELSNWHIVTEYADFFNNFKHYKMFIAGISAVIPLLVLALPIFDTILVSILRVLNGLAIVTPGKDHSSHRLTQMKGKLQRIIDKSILVAIRAMGRRKKAQLPALKGIAHTRAVLILYAGGLFAGTMALLVPYVSAFGAVFILVSVFIVALWGAKKLSAVLVYTKK
jgi:UDP-GlcNAc:undecaprenyl-phosphate/decaprenyl-phosphate GlcNAc-1-phosphate transferase